MPSISQREHDRMHEIVNQMQVLVDEFRSLLQINEDNNPLDEDDNNVVEDWIGQRVRIVRGRHEGQVGVITRRRGSLFWWIRLEDGREIYKMPANFRMLAPRRRN